MKTTILLALVLSLLGRVSAQIIQFGTDLTLSQPVGMMKSNLNNSFGVTLHAANQFKTPFSAGIELNFGNYGQQTTRQEYTFDDGSVTETDVNVSNNIFNLFLTGKHFFRNDKNISPYLSAKAGWSWLTTSLVIEDPADEFSCHPIESDILSRDNTYTFSGGAGLRIDFQSIFKNMDTQFFFFDLSVHATHGGTVQYMNVEKKVAQGSPDQDVIAKFINTQNQVIHEHHVGYVYSSVLNMVEYKIGVICRPGPKLE